LLSPDLATPGNGLLLFFRVDDFDLALQRARGLVPRFEEEPHLNPNTERRSSRFEIRTDTTSRSARFSFGVVAAHDPFEEKAREPKQDSARE
jgi:hypothetical protein